MSYKLSSGLSPFPNVIEIADFWEVECLRRVDNTVSVTDIARILGIMDDVQEKDAEQVELEQESLLQETVSEIQRRIYSCAGKYPYKLDNRQNVLSFDDPEDGIFLNIYLYLLFATRNNMNSNKILNDIDGTLIFEEFCAGVLMNYLGCNSSGLIFGTGVGGNFYEKLNNLKNGLSEGSLHPKNESITYVPKDDKLDVVAWIPFNDGQPSKIICFGQCKTGTHWEGTTTQLRVSDFLKKWFSQPPALNPIETLLIADVINPVDYYHKSVNNLLLDRCRLLNYSTNTLDCNEWFQKMKRWNSSLMEQFKLSFNYFDN